ncbi:MAG: radical SAM protein [Armatimonadetes bacterium]|nr:radical SAM protein [Armatimonadota bacterium]
MRVSLVLTHQCNLACTYCYAGTKFRRSMDFATGLKALRLAFSKPGPVEVSFFGGEPMIEFSSMARFTRIAHRMARRQRREVRFAITTNATILGPKQVSFLRHYDFWVALSVDGLGEEHDRHRPFVNGRASSPLVWTNLEKAVEELPRLHILMVVNPDTVDGLVPALERMYRLGVSRVSLLPNLEADWDEAARARTTECYRRLAGICYLSMESGEPLWLSPFVDQHPASMRDGGCGGGCGFGEDEVAVSPLGRLYPCARLVGTDTRPEVQIGTLDTGPLPARIEELVQVSEERLAGCGTGCRCIPLMPGELPPQLDNSQFFSQMVASICREVWKEIQEVAA